MGLDFQKLKNEIYKKFEEFLSKLVTSLERNFV